LITLPNQIREFLLAVLSSYSYDLKRNLYIWFGVFWGLPIPLVTLFYEYRILASSGNDGNLSELLHSPMQWLFLLHPVLFGVIFGILGTVRQEKELKLADTISQLRDLTVHDQLTGLKNRRYFAHNFHDECARSHRRNEHLSLLFLDIDYFKRINDEYGHHIGDVVLREIGNYLHSQCRPYDTPVRWGGEEFLLLLRSTDEAGAVLFAERIRAGVSLGISQEIPFPFTISIGIAEHLTGDTLEEIVNRADQALYHAKKTGRNRAVPWSALLSKEEVVHVSLST
jgi:diguanylate cyclase (GGDEF)-like protein